MHRDNQMMNQTENHPRSATGIAGLDDILGGGFIPHRLYLIDGDPGAGKTTLSLQYLIEGQRVGEKGLYVTLSETREELLEVANSHGWSLDGIEIVELVASEKDLTSDTQLTMYHPSEVELSETTKAVLDAVQRINPQRVVFDSLSEMRLLAQNSLRYRRQILALKQFFIGRQCTVLLLDDRTNEDRDTQLQSIAHGVLAMEQMAPEYGAERRRVRILKFRGTPYRGGYHDFAIIRGGLIVYPRLIAAEHNGQFPPGQIKSGVSALDSLLGGGPDRGTSTLLVGPAGAGKSTIAVQYAVAAAQRGDHAVVFAFDESAATLEARMNSLGVHLDQGRGPGKLRIQPIDPAEVSPGEFGYLVRDCVERDQARVVVIDSLNGYLNSMPEERFLTIQLHELLNYLGRKGVITMMVVAQHGLMGVAMQSPVDASYLADSVILLRYFENQGKVKKAISVVKKRSGSHEESIRELSFSSKGIKLSEPLRHFQGILTGVPTIVGPVAQVELSGDREVQG
jgi:circadian clock protein KaiC